ncbi:MAG: hypothetical protein U5N58_12015 [Actinomycetota bacterium]|nr:hypothetical protein [Actinomycetota bacterium]
MEDFTGFNRQDFTFFIDMPADYKRVIKQKMATFGDRVYALLPPQVQHSFKRNETTAIKEEVPRSLYSIGKAYSDRTNFQLCGLAITINLVRLSFSAVIRGGSFMDSKPIGFLYNKIANGPDKFMDLLASFGSDYFLHVFKRVPAKGDKIRPNLEKWETISTFNLGMVNFEMIEYLLAVLEQDKLPGVQLSYGIHAGNEILTDVDRLTGKAVKCISREYQLLDYLED